MKAAHRGDKAALARIELRQFHSTLDSLGATAHKEAVLNVTWRNFSQQVRQHAAQWIKQFLRRQWTFLQLRLHGPHDLRMRPAKIEQAEPAQAVDVLATQHILEGCAASCTLDCREVSSFRDRLAILDKATVVIFREIIYGGIDQPFCFAFAQCLLLDNVEIPL